MKDLFDKIAVGILALLGLWAMSIIVESMLSRFPRPQGRDQAVQVAPAASRTVDPSSEE